jgi:hypothetical protein
VIHPVGTMSLSFGGLEFPVRNVEYSMSEKREVAGTFERLAPPVEIECTFTCKQTNRERAAFVRLVTCLPTDGRAAEFEMLYRRALYRGGRKARSAVRRLARRGRTR